MRNALFLSLNFTPYITRSTPASMLPLHRERHGRDVQGKENAEGCIQLITRQIIHVQKTVPNCSANRPYLGRYQALVGTLSVDSQKTDSRPLHFQRRK